MIEAKIDITINIPELTPELQQEIKEFRGIMPIRNEDLEDYDPAEVRVYPKAEWDLALQSLAAKLLKDMCKGRDSCKGCLFYEYDEGCTIYRRPELWKI